MKKRCQNICGRTFKIIVGSIPDSNECKKRNVNSMGQTRFVEEHCGGHTQGHVNELHQHEGEVNVLSRKSTQNQGDELCLRGGPSLQKGKHIFSSRILVGGATETSLWSFYQRSQR